MPAAKGTLYTYPDNFRAYKAQIAAKYSGAQVNLAPNFVFGESNKEAAFLAKFPFGKVPAFESADGSVKLSESNAIAHYLATDELRGGKCATNQALVQQWISFADSEVLPAACQLTFPIMGVMQQNKTASDKAREDLKKALSVLDKFFLHQTFLVGERITLADIVLTCTLLLPYKHALDTNARKPFRNVERWLVTMLNQPNVKAVLGQVDLCQKVEQVAFVAAAASGDKKDNKKKDKKKEEKKDKKEEKKEAAAPAGDDALLAPKKQADPWAGLPKSSFDLDDFKRFYSNNEEDKSVPYFWEKFDAENFSIWRCDYKYNDELAMTFMSANLIGGMFQRIDKMRKNAFASMCLFGVDNDSSISGIWVWKGHDLAFELTPDWQVDYSSYSWKKLDPKSDETKKQVEQYLKWEGNDPEGRKFDQGKIFK